MFFAANSTIRKFFRKLKLVLWKNFLLKRRHYIVTGIEIILPVIWVLVFLYVYFVIPIHKSEDKNNKAAAGKRLPDAWTASSTGRFLHYSPNNSVTKILVSGLTPYFRDVIGFEDAESMPNNKIKKDDDQKGKGPWEVIFTNPFPVAGTIPKTLSYQLRDDSNYHTETLKWKNPPPGSKYEDKFIFIQHQIAVKYLDLVIESKSKIRIYRARNGSDNISTVITTRATTTESTTTGYNGSGFSTVLPVYIDVYPMPLQSKNDEFWKLMDEFVAFYALIGFIITIPIITRIVVCEKAEGVKELMQVMSLPGWIHWTGWFITSYIILFISMVICVLLLCLPAIFFKSMLFYSRPELVLILLLLIPAACIMFSFFVTTFFYNVTIAICCNIIIWLFLCLIPELFYGLNPVYSNINKHCAVIMCFFPILVLKFIVISVVSLERQGYGLQWTNLENEEVIGELTPLILIVMLIVQIILYAILIWYFDKIFPGPYGFPHPLYFPFTKRYWGKSKKNEKPKKDPEIDQSEAESPRHGGLFGKLMRTFKRKKGVPLLDASKPEEEPEEDAIILNEDEPKNLTKVIQIINVTETFGTFVKVTVVDNVTLNAYEDQITIIVGPNGAGKTSLMSSISGIYYISKGTVIVKDYDIQTNLSDIRERIGVCPQNNMLFKSLTTEENLKFYAKLKRVSPQRLKYKVNNLLERLKLTDSRHIQAKDLSVGTMRRLHLAIALIGNSLILILDEPTVGMDNDTRRETWKLLKAATKGRTILLTTHSMDEALLGDRIAIMENGKIRSCGSTAFLKNKLGTGYHLYVTKTEKCDDAKLTHFIQEAFPNASVERQTESEIRYIIREDDSEEFRMLIMRLEDTKDSLQISSLGVSLMTMEEVSLNIEKTTPQLTKEPDYKDKGAFPIGTKKNTDATLKIQQIYGLTVKRFHYYRRRYILFLFPIIFPALLLAVFLLWYNWTSHKSIIEPPFKLDLLPYGATVVHFSANNKSLEDYYAASLPAGTEVYREKNVNQSILASERCKSKCAIAANLVATESNASAAAFYNGHFLHSLPISINYIHNAFLDYYAGSSNWKIDVVNSPWANQQDRLKWMPLEFIYFLFGMFIILGLSILIACFIILLIHERASGSKHLQFLTGVGAVIYWGTTFIWDFLLYLLAVICLVVILLLLGDPLDIYVPDSFGLLILFLILFGFAMIPLAYLFTFMFTSTTVGFTVVLLLNVFSVLGVLILLALKIYNRNFWKTFDVLPAFSVCVGIFKAAVINFRTNEYRKNCNYDEEFLNSSCSESYKSEHHFKCCPDCKSYYESDELRYAYDRHCYWPGDDSILAEILIPIIMGIIFFILLFVIDAVPLYKLRYLFSGNNVEKKSRIEMDKDVEKERQRIHEIINTDDCKGDVLIMYDLTKEFGSLIAVDHLNVGIKKGECFGLLGITDSGKTTTLNMISGRRKMTFGNAYMWHIDIRSSRGKYLRKISYFPEPNALNDYLSGREHLILFARLRGTYEHKIKYTVERYINLVGIEKDSRKITLHYSDGTKRKLCAGIALIGAPPIVICDEPTLGLDAITRDKIWDILNFVKLSGTAVIIASKQMEECEAICTRIGILVNGKLQGLGGTQYLKGKFGEGFSIVAKVSQDLKRSEDVHIEDLQKYIETNFKNFTLQESKQRTVHYHVHGKNISLARAFEIMDQAKSLFNLEEFSIMQASLEDVYIHLAMEPRPLFE